VTDIEWVGTVEFTGVNQAHKNVADVSAMAGLVEQGVSPMSDRCQPSASSVSFVPTGNTNREYNRHA
jgi:hypothetical protein